MIYANSKPDSRRLRIIGSAVERVANSLRLSTKISWRKKLLSIHVYYRSHSGDEIPVYCDWGKGWEEEEVYRSIRNMMFVLSFHPLHSRLQSIRKEVFLSA